MGRLIGWLVAAGLAIGLALVTAAPAYGFDGFGDSRAESTYGEVITFEVTLDGGTPDRLELLIRTPGSDASFVTPIEGVGDEARHVWNTSADYVVPNTPITYQWRATHNGEVTLSQPATHRYRDDRPGLDWRSEQLGEATVHWYGDADAQARRFGELTAQGVARAEELLGTDLAGPVDVFVYDAREDFFGALGPGVREWTGAAAYSELRTIFMWLGGGSTSYLEVAMLHEVTHIVFHDATDNPFHEPARWLNEGVATWAERGEADDERALVVLEAGGGGLLGFEAITEQFPIGERGGRLAYAQGATMIARVVDEYGERAIAAIAAAYRDGASDAEALEAGTGVPADDLYADFYAAFGVAVPQPIQPEPIGPSNVERPPVGSIDVGGVDPDAGPDGDPGEAGPSAGAAPDDPASAPDEGSDTAVLVALLAGAAVLAGGAAVLVARRAAREGRT